MIFKNTNNDFEVIDNAGDVVASYRNEEEARNCCKALGVPDTSISWDELRRMRENSGVYEKPEGSVVPVTHKKTKKSGC